MLIAIKHKAITVAGLEALKDKSYSVTRVSEYFIVYLLYTKEIEHAPDCLLERPKIIDADPNEQAAFDIAWTAKHGDSWSVSHADTNE